MLFKKRKVGIDCCTAVCKDSGDEEVVQVDVLNSFGRYGYGVDFLGNIWQFEFRKDEHSVNTFTKKIDSISLSILDHVAGWAQLDKVLVNGVEFSFQPEMPCAPNPL